MKAEIALRWVALISVAIFAGCTSERSVVSDFKTLVRDAEIKTTKRQEPYFNEYVKQWSRRKFEIEDLRIDVRKTESLTLPYAGTVTFKLYHAQTPPSTTRNTAESDLDPERLQSNKYEITLQYHFSDKWTFSNGQASRGIVSAGQFEVIKLPFDRAKIEAEPATLPSAPLIYWLTPK